MSTPDPTTPLNIGPGPLKPAAGSPFLLSNDDWTSIERYFRPVFGTENLAALQKAVDLANADGDDLLEGFRIAGQLIYKHYELWSKTTFPAILTLVADIAAFGRQCGVAYKELESNSVTNLAERASTLAGQSDIAAQLTNDFLALVRADEPTITENFSLSLRRWNRSHLPGLQDVSELLAQFAKDLLVNNSDPFQRALGVMVGAWRAIASDLREVQKILQSAVTDDPVILPFDLELARTDWLAVAVEAEALVQNASRF